MIGVLGLYKRYATRQGVAAPLSFFPGGKRVAMKKSENIEYLWHSATDFLHFFPKNGINNRAIQ